VQRVEQAVYLGGLVTSDGNPATELSRRIGEASRALEALARVWKHANVPKKRKIEIYKACVLPKLLYGLETFWLRGGEQKRLNGFHARCLRRVLGVPHPQVSHVSNAEVLQRAQEKPLFHTLLERQMLLYGRLVRMPGGSMQRDAALAENSPEPAEWPGKRRKGRPRQTWASEVFKRVRAAFGEGVSAADLAQAQPEVWKCRVSAYITGMGMAESGEQTEAGG